MAGASTGTTAWWGLLALPRLRTRSRPTIEKHNLQAGGLAASSSHRAAPRLASGGLLRLTGAVVARQGPRAP